MPLTKAIKYTHVEGNSGFRSSSIRTAINNKNSSNTNLKKKIGSRYVVAIFGSAQKLETARYTGTDKKTNKSFKLILLGRRTGSSANIGITIKL
jgi:hypothetical protein